MTTHRTSKRALLIDGGQSGCRVALARDGVVGEVETLPGLRRVGRAYESLRALAARYEVDLVAAGLTGYTGEDVDFGVPSLLTNDAVTAYLGALGEAPGAVVIGGTGAIALASGPDGRWWRVDGWGTLLGDAGGGYWIARRALELALREADGRGGSPELLELAEARYGPDIIHAVYDAADPTATIAAFTRDVAGAADAVPIFAAAGRELAHTVLAALERAGAPPNVSYVGGLFAAGELILAPLQAELGFALQPPLGDCLAGTARLAAGTDLFATLVHGAAP